MNDLFQTLFYDKRISELYTAEKSIRYLLDFEAHLAKSQAECTFIPSQFAEVIAHCCKVEKIDISQLKAQVGLGGNIAIPLVKQLTSVVKAESADASKFVHFGATSQDVIDTAMMLQCKDAIHLMLPLLTQSIEQLRVLALAHQDTFLIGRSFMQQARPISFDYKVAIWIDSLQRAKQRLESLKYYLQLGGAVGTLASMPHKGLAIAQRMATNMGLEYHPISWHTQRDFVVEIATTLGMLSGSLGKIAKDISLLMQTEIAEVFEPAGKGKGGSSTMPHKRNPVSSIAILANAQRVPNLIATLLSAQVQDHERATGAWHSEWETLAQVVQLTAGSVRQMSMLTNGLEVNPDKMLANLEITQGLIYAENLSFALAETIGKSEAHEMVEELCKEATAQGKHLKELALENAKIRSFLSEAHIQELFSPQNSIGFAHEMAAHFIQ
ncbi:3-carboxy-cis,cis-muconate cycloisomerase [Flectobacillus roseus]|uniref:3-carboxy-cis,cis-muconate cycloisomerase n=1 Tax=Flectobacillus roseus TaxID=502259 RepID=UPI0024B7C13B|nr:3-carboxy-cis,cis-muconate cycloisomerase [Flectobacillus roseus]MDI9869742.1 3-carboxy-cis,cis-muconate cycloisomerase [Flectobacillus roseus]